MAYKKFDDPDPKVNQSIGKGYDAFPMEAIRRAIQAVANRVISGTGGTYTLAGAGSGASAGFAFASPVKVSINGVMSTVAAQGNLLFGSLGTMGTNTVAKFLICTKDGTSGTVVGPGNVVSKNDYASATLAAAAAKIPDLPDGAAPLAYVTLQAPATTVLVLTGGATTAAANLGYILGSNGTAGTATYVDLVCMPYDG
jgi:hypothetical protein